MFTVMIPVSVRLPQFVKTCPSADHQLSFESRAHWGAILRDLGIKVHKISSRLNDILALYIHTLGFWQLMFLKKNLSVSMIYILRRVWEGGMNWGG